MCGIAGFLGFMPQADETLRRMTGALSHRGPDAEGFYTDGDIHLGHRRLAVIGLENGRQPMFNEDATIAVVFNGEIYNFVELRQRLMACGHRFTTHTDGEVLVHGYEQWGDSLLDQLHGMFAFVLWDGRRRRLLAARDHLGVKPLHYSWSPASGSFAFASELNALLEHPKVSRELDLEALGLLLECQYIPTPRCIYRDICKLPAGHAISIENGKFDLFRFWRVDYQHKFSLSEDDAADLVETALRTSVRSMLVADVPLGVLLSGGVDSSLIAALAVQESAKPVDTFTLGFSGKVADSEHEVAARVARHIGSRHHTLMLDAEDVLNAFSDGLDVFHEPFADQAALPTLLLARFARKQVTVALTGEGADEVFGGYFNYLSRLREERLSGLLGHRFSPLPMLLRHLPARLRKDRLLKAIMQPRPRRYATIANMFDSALRGNLYSPAFRAAHRETVADYAADIYAECNSESYLDHLLHVDLSLWLPDDLLTKVDRASMACALEVRVPYLDHHFVQLCARLAPKLKCHGRVGKYLLKKVAARHLPQDIVRRGKQGFVMPLSEWLAGPLKSAVLESLVSLGKCGIFAPSVLNRLQNEHYAGRRNNSGRLWTLHVLGQWLGRFAPGFVV